MKPTIQFRRGQVWYVDDNYSPLGSIQGKSRPYVVVSNDTCNRYSPVIHMAPITSQCKKTSQPTHILFFNPRKKQNNWILVEQTMPKSIPDIIDVSDYQYTLSSDIMQEIDRALSIQFGLKSFGVDISEFEVMLDMIVEQKIAQIQDATQSLLDARMSKYVNALLDRVADAGKLPEPETYVPSAVVLQQMQYAPASAIPQQDTDVATPLPEITIVQPTAPATPKSADSDTSKGTLKASSEKESDAELTSTSAATQEKKSTPTSAIDKFTAKWGKRGRPKSKKASEEKPAADSANHSDKSEPSITTIQRIEITHTPKGRIRWTTDLKKQFLTDLASYDADKVCALYDMAKSCLQPYRRKFTQELRDAGLISGEAVSSTVSKKGRPRKAHEPRKSKKVMQFDASVDEMLRDYDEMPISKFMEKYSIPTRAQAVELAAKLRS